MAFGSVFFVSRAIARDSESPWRAPQQIWCQKNATFSSCPFWCISTQSLTPRPQWAIVGVPTELWVEQGRGARDGKAPVDQAILLARRRHEGVEVLARASPAHHVGRRRLLAKDRHHRVPIGHGA